MMVNKAKYGESTGSSARRDPKGERDSTGNGVQDFGETELMERHQHGPDPVGPGKVIKTDD
jgi:hypothetical protein